MIYSLLKIAIFGQSYHSNTADSVEILLDYLANHNSRVYIESEFYKNLKSKSHLSLNNLNTFDTLDDSFHLMVSIGGDGTILRAITRVEDLSIPIVGINTGRLGFLATIQPDFIAQAFDDIFAGNYRISERTLLCVETNPENDDLKHINYALNEIAVSRKNTTSMITVDTQLDGEFLTSYWSDGLIISTPTGSTGYSLSCGGPIIAPEANNICINTHCTSQPQCKTTGNPRQYRNKTKS